MKLALDALGYKKGELSILITDDERIRELNRKFLRHDRPTNVLAFPMQGEDIKGPYPVLGDIVISVDTAIKEAERYGIGLETYVVRLLIHGLLHLLGYDHERGKAEEEEMLKEEERILKIIYKEEV